MEREIGILADSALFLAEDQGIVRLLAGKGRQASRSGIALGDPGSWLAAGYGEEAAIGDALPAATRSALALCTPLNEVENVEIRLHRTVLYNSIYRADNQLLINQHAHGLPAGQTPVFCLRTSPSGEMAALYFDSFERVWVRATPLA